MLCCVIHSVLISRYITNDKYFIQPVESSQTLIIDRVSRDINLNEGWLVYPSRCPRGIKNRL